MLNWNVDKKELQKSSQRREFTPTPLYKFLGVNEHAIIKRDDTLIFYFFFSGRTANLREHVNQKLEFFTPPPPQ